MDSAHAFEHNIDRLERSNKGRQNFLILNLSFELDGRYGPKNRTVQSAEHRAAAYVETVKTPPFFAAPRWESKTQVSCSPEQERIGHIEDLAQKYEVPLAGARIALIIIDAMDASAPGIAYEASSTGDGGMALEYVSRETGRDLLFAVPGDGEQVFFVARGPSGFRQAGAIISERGYSFLGGWLVDLHQAIPTKGVVLA